jgi:hypothetical protein
MPTPSQVAIRSPSPDDPAAIWINSAMGPPAGRAGALRPMRQDAARSPSAAAASTPPAGNAQPASSPNINPAATPNRAAPAFRT